MQKEGFIYIWYDRKNNMFYIGCHWGYTWDNYICSSDRMRKAYRKRPHDFKRRIIQRNIPRENLLEEEHKWLQLIPDRELGCRYYNHSKKHFGHWSNTQNAQEIRKRCTQKTKPTFTPQQLEERGRKISESKQRKKEERIALGLPARQKEKIPREPKGPQSPESNVKRSEAMKRAWQEGRNLGTTGLSFEWTTERKEKHKYSVQGCHVNRNSASYSNAGKKAWSEGKYAQRRSNNMRNYIWVTLKDGSHTRIRKETYDPNIHVRGRN